MLQTILNLLGKFGNVMDLPGSSVRDLITGNNPFDQWMTPTEDVNRVSGRDVLSQFGLMRPNHETGMSGWLSDPGEGLRDIGGALFEGLLDPTNLLPANWVGKVLKSRKATAAANAAIGGKYGYVNPKVAARPAAEVVSEVASSPMKLLGYTPTRTYNPEAAAHFRRQLDALQEPAMDASQEVVDAWRNQLYSLTDSLRGADPTQLDRRADLYSSPLSGMTRGQWLEKVVPQNMALQKVLGGLDMSQSDNQMVFSNLASAFGDKNPFAENSPLMNMLHGFAGDIADIESKVVDPLYDALRIPDFADMLKKTASDLGEHVDDYFEHLAPELLHEGPASRQSAVFQALREKLPSIIANNRGHYAAHSLEQLLNVAHIYDNPFDAAMTEYDRLIASVGNSTRAQPMLPVQRQSTTRILPGPESPLTPTMAQRQIPASLRSPLAAGFMYNMLARQRGEL